MPESQSSNTVDDNKIAVMNTTTALDNIPKALENQTDNPPDPQKGSNIEDHMCAKNSVVIKPQSTAQHPENQSSNPSESRTEEMRWSHFRTTNALCVLLILAVLTATTVTFCITKSPLSFSLLSCLTALPHLRHRIEIYLFPLSEEDLLLELMKLKRHQSTTGHSRFAWFHHLTGKQP